MTFSNILFACMMFEYYYAKIIEIWEEIQWLKKIIKLITDNREFLENWTSEWKPDNTVHVVYGVTFAVLVYAVYGWFLKDRKGDTCDCSFNYCDKGPTTWKAQYETGRNQSPINITTNQCHCFPTDVLKRNQPALKWNNFKKCPISMSLVKQDETVIITGAWKDKETPCLEYTPSSQAYIFEDITFRWGPTDDEGSEHTIDYVRYAMEIQASFRKQCYRNMSEAFMSEDPEALLILSYLVEAVQRDNLYLNSIICNLWKIKEGQSLVEYTPMRLRLPLNSNGRPTS